MTTATRLVPSDDPNAYARWVRRQRAYGRWQPFVDAQPARDHITRIMVATGTGWRRVADHAGVPRSTVGHLLYGSKGRLPARIHPDNARRLLALHVGSAQAITVPAAGTHRRIHVLIGEGWPRTHLGPQFGTHPQYVHQILSNARVTAGTARAVADAYMRLRGTDPAAGGATAHGIKLARNAARRHGWPDRSFWDDVDRIDDPDFDSGTVGDTPKYMRLGEDALWLREQGYTRGQVADRLGETAGYIDQSVRRYRDALVAAQGEKQGAA